MPKTNVLLPDSVLYLPLTHGFHDDFAGMTSNDVGSGALAVTETSADGKWLCTGDTGSTIAVTSDAVGGECGITNDGTDEDMTLLVSFAEVFLFAADKPLTFLFRAKYTEANTDDANIFMGLSDVATTNLMVDADAGPATTFDGCGFYKAGSSDNWAVITSNATTQTKTVTDVDASTSNTSYYTFRCDVRPVSSLAADIFFWIDTSGLNAFAPCRETGAHPRTPDIKHNILFSGLQEMHFVAGIKNGSGTAETLTLDYASCYQTR